MSGSCAHDWTWTIDRRADLVVDDLIIKNGLIFLRCNGCGEIQCIKDAFADARR